MWPFCRKVDVDNQIELHTKEWPIGREFQYLGINMKVTNNIKWVYDDFILGVDANYVDRHGVIREIKFTQRELKHNI